MSSNSLPTLSSAKQIQTIVKRELVPVEEWGYAVWVAGLDAGGLDEYRAPMYEFDVESGKMKLNMRGQNVRLAALTMEDEHGNLIYPDLEEGIADLNTKDAAGVEKVAKVARRLSGMGDDSGKVMEGNSAAGQTGDSPSA